MGGASPRLRSSHRPRPLTHARPHFSPLQLWTAYHALANMASLFAIMHPEQRGRDHWCAQLLYWESLALTSVGAGDLVNADRQAPLKPRVPNEPSLVDHAIGSCLLIASTLRINGNVSGGRRWLKAARCVGRLPARAPHLQGRRRR